MKRLRALVGALLLALALPCASSAQQSPPATIQFQGLRSVNHQGSLQAAAFTPDGNLVLLFNQGDGLRLLKTDPQAQTLLAEIQLGAAGDSGVALATDPSGNLYVVGTSSSGSLPGTSGAVFPTPVDTSVNSFLAKFDPNLNLLFLTFLGASHTAATAVAATADAAFVTGSTYSTSFPTTPTAAQPTPALDSEGNGFVQRFSSDGTARVYSTYLTGSGGSTTPTAVVADSADNATIAGSTSAPGFPTTPTALQPAMLGAVTGFLTKITPGGNTLLFSTFVAGSGLSSLALDPTSSNLLATGNIDPGEFPLATVSAPIANAPYQTLLRLSPDGQTLLDSALLLPGTRSAVTPGPNGTVWITGPLSTPPFATQDATSLGDSYLLHLTAQDTIDQIFRHGGSPTQNPGYAHLSTASSAAVLSPSGTLLIVASTLTAQTDSSFANTQTFDLPLVGNSPAVLPNSVRDLLPAQCATDLPCSGSAAFLSAFSTTAAPSPLSLSTGDLSALILRNPGTTSAANLSLSAPGSTLTSNCPQTLPAASQCAIDLSDSAPATLSVTSSSAPSLSISLPSPARTPQPLAFSTAELDFGIVTYTGSPVTQTVTITNLSGTAQNFASTPDDALTNSPFTLAELASTCQGPASAHIAPANGSCTVTLGLSASASSSNDGPVRSAWKLGDRDLTLTGFTQAASLTLSSPLLDFGIQIPGSATQLPRFLYLSNSSPLPIDHAPLALPSNSPFALTDNCPSTLQPNTVCQIRFTYTQTTAPTLDSFALTLDEGLTVLLEGETATAQTSLATLPLSPLVVSPSAVQFSSPVPSSETSSEVQTVQVTNPTQAGIPLMASVLGDFALQNPCSPTLPPGESCTLSLQFTPSQSGTREGLLTLSAGSTVQPITVPLSGTAIPLLTPADTTVELGQTSIAEPVVHWMQVQGTLPNLAAAVSGSPFFAVALLPDDGNGHGTLPPTAFARSASAQCIACWLAIQFLPTATGDFTAQLHLATDPSGIPSTLALHGTATPTQGLLLTPAATDSDAVPVHSTAAATTFTLTNLLPGATTLTLQSIATTGDFNVLSSTSPFACANMLPPAASCRIDIAFSPTAQGLRAGVLTVVTSSGNATANLTGTGTPDPGLALNPTTLTFAGNHSTATLTLTDTGAGVLTFSPLLSSDPAFTIATDCTTLSPGQSCTATVSLTGNPASGSPLLTFTTTSPNADGAAQPDLYAVPLQVLGAQPVVAFPTQADFGAQLAEAPGAIRQFEIVNTSSTPETLAITFSRNFPLTSPNPCATLQPAATCTFSAIFLPQEAGPLTGEITITPSTPDGSAGTPILIYLQGYGTGAGTLTVSNGTAPDDPLDFSQVNSGQSASQSLTIINAGATPASLRRLTSTAPFQVSNSCPATLAPGASCSLSILYSPVFLDPDATTQSVRTDTGTLLLETDDPASPITVYLAGTVASTSTATSSTPTALPTYTLSQSALSFANTLAGQLSAPQAILVTNSGTVPVVFTSIAASSEFAAYSTCTTLPPGSTCTLTAVFTPDAGASNSAIAGTLTLQSNAATATDFISLLGPSFQTPLTASPATLSFSPILLGSSAPLSITLTNVTGLPLLLSQPSSQGDFAVTGGTCATTDGTLAPGATCTYVITFTPTAPGSRTGALSIPTGASTQPLTISLQGTALAGHLQASPQALNFGTLNLTASAAQTLTLTDTGNADLTGLALTLTGPSASDFTTASTCTPSLTVTGSCTVQVTFTPSAPGSRTATLAIASSDPSSPTLIPLTGTGAQPPGITLTVNGTNTASATIASGASASFGLTLTPQGGYSAGVALTCSAITPAPNTICSLSNPSIAALSGPVQNTALLKTENGYSASPFALTLLSTLPWIGRRRRSKHTRPRASAILTAGLLCSILLASCASGPGTNGNLYTPPGTYLYQVTATSTSGPPLSSTVTLTLTVH